MSRAEQAHIEAADWLIAQAEGPLSEERQAEFDAWLNASDGNKAAYWRLEYGWGQADRIGALGHGPIEASSETDSGAKSRWWIPAAIAASIIAAVGIQQFATEWPGQKAAPTPIVAQSYSTPLGGKRLLGLADGSRIQLNTQSRLRTGISDARREVWLDQGEAFFEVAHRDGQPFIVHAGDRQITVLGTKFSVRRDGSKVIVTVLEGRVRVDELSENRPVRSSIIAGGDIAVAEGSATLVTARSEAKVDSALSWRRGMLTFDQQPLTTIATEFNRYNAKKLVLKGQSVGTIRITGTFPSNKPDAFARLLRDAYGMGVEDTDSEIRVSH